MPEDRSQINVRIPKSLLQHIKQSASDEGVTVSEWIKDACSKKLEGDKETSSSEPSSTSSNGEESYKSLQQNILALQHQIDHIRNSMPALEDMSSTSSSEKISELEEKIKLLEDNQSSHADRLGEVEEKQANHDDQLGSMTKSLEGVSCVLPEDGSVGNSPHPDTDITSDSSSANEGVNPNYTYTANTLAPELGMSPRSLRRQLQQKEDGDIYQRDGKQYKLISKKPYKLVLVE